MTERDRSIAAITPEQDEELLRLIRRSDALNNARVDLEDHATGKVPEERLQASLAVLMEECEPAAENAHRFREEIGFRPE